MIAILITLWLWDAPTCEQVHHFRVSYVHIYQIGQTTGHDDLGNPVPMPIYSPWTLVLVQESLDTTAMIPCEPLQGELCAIEVKSIDDADNPDVGTECP